jgi:hypothetical protein
MCWIRLDRFSTPSNRLTKGEPTGVAPSARLVSAPRVPVTGSPVKAESRRLAAKSKG